MGEETVIVVRVRRNVGMAITLAIMTYVFGTAQVSAETGHPVLSGTAGMIARIAANLYVFSFSFSRGPVAWVLLGEMFPNKIRVAALP